MKSLWLMLPVIRFAPPMDRETLERLQLEWDLVNTFVLKPSLLDEESVRFSKLWGVSQLFHWICGKENNSTIQNASNEKDTPLAVSVISTTNRTSRVYPEPIPCSTKIPLVQPSNVNDHDDHDAKTASTIALPRTASQLNPMDADNKHNLDVSESSLPAAFISSRAVTTSPAEPTLPSSPALTLPASSSSPEKTISWLVCIRAGMLLTFCPRLILTLLVVNLGTFLSAVILLQIPFQIDPTLDIDLSTLNQTQIDSLPPRINHTENSAFNLISFAQFGTSLVLFGVYINEIRYAGRTLAPSGHYRHQGPIKTTIDKPNHNADEAAPAETDRVGLGPIAIVDDTLANLSSEKNKNKDDEIRSKRHVKKIDQSIRIFEQEKIKTENMDHAGNNQRISTSEEHEARAERSSTYTPESDHASHTLAGPRNNLPLAHSSEMSGSQTPETLNNSLRVIEASELGGSKKPERFKNTLKEEEDNYRDGDCIYSISFASQMIPSPLPKFNYLVMMAAVAIACGAILFSVANISFSYIGYAKSMFHFWDVIILQLIIPGSFASLLPRFNPGRAVASKNKKRSNPTEESSSNNARTQQNDGFGEPNDKDLDTKGRNDHHDKTKLFLHTLRQQQQQNQQHQQQQHPLQIMIATDIHIDIANSDSDIRDNLHSISKAADFNESSSLSKAERFSDNNNRIIFEDNVHPHIGPSSFDDESKHIGAIASIDKVNTNDVNGNSSPKDNSSPRDQPTKKNEGAHHLPVLGKDITYTSEKNNNEINAASVPCYKNQTSQTVSSKMIMMIMIKLIMIVIKLIRLIFSVMVSQSGLLINLSIVVFCQLWLIPFFRDASTVNRSLIAVVFWPVFKILIRLLVRNSMLPVKIFRNIENRKKILSLAERGSTALFMAKFSLIMISRFMVTTANPIGDGSGFIEAAELSTISTVIDIPMRIFRLEVESRSNKSRAQKKRKECMLLMNSKELLADIFLEFLSIFFASISMSCFYYLRLSIDLGFLPSTPPSHVYIWKLAAVQFVVELVSAIFCVSVSLKMGHPISVNTIPKGRFNIILVFIRQLISFQQIMNVYRLVPLIGYCPDYNDICTCSFASKSPILHNYCRI